MVVCPDSIFLLHHRLCDEVELFLQKVDKHLARCHLDIGLEDKVKDKDKEYVPILSVPKHVHIELNKFTTKLLTRYYQTR